MRVAVVTSVSSAIAGYASMTTPNKAAYCLRHGYSLVVDDAPYMESVAGVSWLLCLFLRYDMLWCLDADAVITHMGTAIHTLPCLGPHVTACEEGIVAWNKVNCGSVVYKNTPETHLLLRQIESSQDRWQHLQCGWQTWIADRAELTVAPLRSFNSCAWNRPGGGEWCPGSHWQRGDFVYHPCGIFPLDARANAIRMALDMVCQ